MREPYTRRCRVLQSLDFHSGLSGFHPFPFAIYDEMTVYFSADRSMARDRRFLGNTVTDLDGRLTAIFQSEPRNPGSRPGA